MVKYNIICILFTSIFGILIGYQMGYSGATTKLENEAIQKGYAVRVTWNTFQAPYVKRQFYWNDSPRPHFIGEQVEGIEK
jgi:hypothetical protein